MGLLVPRVTSVLVAELGRLGLSMVEDQTGYRPVDGAPTAMVVVVLDEVGEAERDELLGAFGDGRIESVEARAWWQQQTGEAMGKLKDMAGHEELERKFIESLPPEKRLAGLAPEQRLAGLAPEQALLALPDELLRGLPADYLAKLPRSIQREIAQRLSGRPARAPRPRAASKARR